MHAVENNKKGLDCLLQKLSHREQGFPENQLKNIKNWKKSKALFDQTEKNHNNYNNCNNIIIIIIIVSIIINIIVIVISFFLYDLHPTGSDFQRQLWHSPTHRRESILN